METPLIKTRRRLKKIMKRTNLSVSTNIYQKKLKSAINVSLNSTHNVRTLQANNRSLAGSLEKMRLDFRQIHDHSTFLLEENHALREKILELQRINASEKHIEEEVNKRFEERTDEMKKKLETLSDLAKGFINTITEIDVCLASSATTIDDVDSSSSTNHNYSLLPKLQFVSTDLSLLDISDIESTQSGYMAQAEIEGVALEKNTAKIQSQVNEMTLIMEQSLLCPSTESYSNSKLGAVLENCLTDKQTTITRLPMRVPRNPTWSKKRTSKQEQKAVGELANVESSKQAGRRETFIISTSEPPDIGLITDIAMPQFLVSDYLDGNEMEDLDISDCVPTPLSPARSRQSCENDRSKGSIRSSSSQSMLPETPHHSEDKSPIKSSPQRTSQTRNQSLTRRTRSRPNPGLSSPKKMSSPAPAEKQLVTKEGNADKKPTTQSKKKKNYVSPTSKKMSPKNVLKPGNQEKQNLYISNEFNLISAYKQRLEKSEIKSTKMLQHLHFEEAGQHTIFPIDDMELTRMENENIKAPIKHISPVHNINNRKISMVDSHIGTTHSRSKSKQTEQSVYETNISPVSDGNDKYSTKIESHMATVHSRSKPKQTGLSVSEADISPVFDGNDRNNTAPVRSKSKSKQTGLSVNEADISPVFDGNDRNNTAPAHSRSTPKQTGLSVNEADISPVFDGNDRNNTKFDSHVASRSKPKQTGLSVNEAESSLDEKVPDAVTMRITKPGQFVFAAARKESDGTRKNVPIVIPKVRSKSKKQISDMIEKLIETKPKSIFDFHDRTPVSLSSDKQAASVINISPDKSVLSPLKPLNKNRSRRKSNSSSNDLSTKSTSHSESHETNKKTYNLLDDYLTFEVPVKDSSPTTSSTYRTRSRSSGRKLYDPESDMVEVRTRSLSRRRRARSRAGSPVGMPSLSVSSPEMLCTKQTSPDSVDQHGEPRSSSEIISINSTSKQSMTSLWDSDALCKQTELNYDVAQKDIQASTIESALVQKSISTPKGPSVKSKSRMHISENKRKTKVVVQDDDKNTFSKPTTAKHFVMQSNEKEYVEDLDLQNTDCNNLGGISEIVKQVNEAKCPASAVAINIKSLDTISSFASTKLLNEMATSTGSAGEYVSSEESTNNRQELKSSETVNQYAGTTLRRKRRSRSKSRKTRVMSPNMDASERVTEDSENASSELTNFIGDSKNRRDRKNGNKCSAESPIKKKSLEGSKSIAVDEDTPPARKRLIHIHDACDEAGTHLLLEKLRHIRTPALSCSQEMVQSESTTPNNDKADTSQKNGNGPRMSKIVRMTSKCSQSVTKRPASENSPESLTVLDGKRRRAATKISYAEMPLNIKLRRGDPFTSHFCTADKIDIFKSQKPKEIKKRIHHNILGSVHNMSISEELGLPSNENSEDVQMH